jgi:hypothetical protein
MSAALLLVYTQGKPCRIPLPFNDEGAIVIGRTHLQLLAPDRRLSRQHAIVEVKQDRWMVRDLGSRNGTWVDRRWLEGPYLGSAPTVIRCGDSLFVPDTGDACAGMTADQTALAVFVVLRTGRPAVIAAPSLIEECLLRSWPGGRRELELEVRAAGECATLSGGNIVFAEHLARRAGRRIGQVDTPTSAF